MKPTNSTARTRSYSTILPTSHKRRYIKMSSPYLNNLIIVGCILTYTSVILLGLDSELTSETSFPYICTARAWVLMAGFTLAFGEVELVSHVVFPVFGVQKRGDIDIIPMNEYCKSEKISIFVGCIYAYKGLLMIFGCLLAWETRTVDIPALNDSKYIGMSVYNVVIMCVIGVPISYILSDDQDASYIIISVFIIFCTTGTLWLVFVPKLIELRRNPSGAIDKRIAIRTTLKPPKRQESESDVSDLHDQLKKAETEKQTHKKTLQEKEQELQVLLLKYGDEILEEIASDKLAVAKLSAAAQITTTASTVVSEPSRNYVDFGWEGPSGQEVSEIAEETSLCSSHNDEYVTSRSPLTTLITSTTSIHHTQISTHSNAHLPHSNNKNAAEVSVCAPPHSCPESSESPQPNLNSTTSTELVNSTSKDEDLERGPRRGVSFVSPSQTPRDISKSVSFRLESGYAKSESEVESIPMQDILPPPTMVDPSAPLEPAPALPPRRKTQERLPSISSLGYSAGFCHEYNPGLLQREIQMGGIDNPPLPPPRMEQPIYPTPQYPPGAVMSHQMPIEMDTALDRRLPYGFVSTESMVPPETRLSMRSEPDYHYNDHGVISCQRIHEGRRESRGNEFPLKLPLGANRLDENPCPDNYSQVPRNVYVPLNNLEERATYQSRRPPDLTIVNNTLSGPASVVQKNSNIRANMNPMPRVPSSRRASEPPHLIGADSFRIRNRSNEELNPRIPTCETDFEQDYKEDWARRRDIEERETARSISRSRLRRDSFGEVVSRRSPSQDSLGISRGSRSSPLLDRPQLDEPSRDRYTPAHDTWSVTGPSSRASPTHDSPEHQWVSGGDGGRAASEESLATMSSRGSIYSVTSARSDALPRRHYRAANARATRPNPLPHLPPFILNGEMADSVASSDDIANPPARGSSREPMSLHRTSSEPHYNFEHLELENRLADPVFLLEQQRQMEGRGGTLALGGTLPRHHQHFQDPTSDYQAGKGRGMDGSGVSGYTSSLRGRSFSGTRTRATTSSVAAALMASKARNVSDNALDHSTSILPIFQKLLSERHRGVQSGRRDCAMSSCPNITIKCDIVEYL
ncbi:GPCR family 3 C-terminal protein [Trinorchestia longiramus]|nr:GPCR family 3 C-terminal protein [Trinorchestia longiramus]